MPIVVSPFETAPSRPSIAQGTPKAFRYFWIVLGFGNHQLWKGGQWRHSLSHGQECRLQESPHRGKHELVIEHNQDAWQKVQNGLDKPSQPFYVHTRGNSCHQSQGKVKSKVGRDAGETWIAIPEIKIHGNREAQSNPHTLPGNHGFVNSNAESFEVIVISHS